MIKVAMCAIHRLLHEGQFRTRMLLQVNDELVFNMSKDEAEIVPRLIENAMIGAIPMSVPVRVELGSGETWLDTH